MGWVLPAVCGGCGRVGALLCGVCARTTVHRVPLRIAGITTVRAVSRYPSSLGRAVLQAKGRPNLALARIVAAHLAGVLAPALRDGRFEALVPAPGNPEKQWQRGFGLSRLIAHALAAELGVPVRDCLILAQGDEQKGLGPRRRAQNLAGRIRAQGSPPGRVLLVDDVVTTGATAEACARELLGGRSSEVHLVVACARPPSERCDGVKQLGQVPRRRT